MNEATGIDALQALIDFADREPSPALRSAALGAAAGFPLDADGWFEIAAAMGRLLQALPHGSPERGAALRVAAGIPLLSVRRWLRELAADPEDPDAADAAEALAAVGDAAVAERVVERIAAGEFDRLPELAAMPLEESALSPDAIPPVPADHDPGLALWRALARARLGDCGALDAYLEGAVEPPPLFWAPPDVAHGWLAAVRPLPPGLRAHLLAALPATDRIEDPDRAAMVRRIVWACTGIADAEGTPVPGVGGDAPTDGPVGRVAPAMDGPVGLAAPEVTDAADEEAGEAAAARILALLDDPAALDAGPAPADLDALAALPPAAANAFLVELLDRACRFLRTQAQPERWRVPTGNAVVAVAERLPAVVGWPVERLAEIYLRADPGPLDREQWAWIIGRAPVAAAIEGLVAELDDRAAAPDRQRLLALADAVGAVYSGRAGSPWRGAGGAGVAPPRRPALIDDLPEASMRGPVTSAGVGEPRAGPVGAGAPDEGAMEEAGLESGEPPAAAGGELDERRVHAQIRLDGKLRQTFVAGEKHVVRCWIGLPDAEDAAVADRAVPTVEIDEEGLPLTVQLDWRGQTPAGRLVLPAARTARTADCDLELRVPAGERYVSATIGFLYGNRMFELVRLEAFVLQPGEPELPHHEPILRVEIDRREVVELSERSPCDATFVYGEEPPAEAGARTPVRTLLEFGAQGAGRYSLGKTARAVAWLSEELFVADTNLVRSRARSDAAGTEPLLDDEDETALTMLRHLAQHGADFYNQLTGQRFTDPGRRIQLLNRTPDEYMPLELVYDRGFPADDARLCDGWRDALAGDDDDCPCCGPLDPQAAALLDNTPTLCPLGFWSLRKIIERLDPLGPAAQGQDRSVPRNGRRSLAPIDRAVFGASHNVLPEDRTETLAALRHIIGDVRLADDWDAWREAVGSAPMPLLIALPHHGVKDAQDYLELGGAETPEPARILKRGRLRPLYVNPRGTDPGPIVLLLGCDTAREGATGYPALARRFQQLHTSIVVGTLAKVLGRHAAPVVREVVQQLAEVDDPEADFGTIMRRVRRRMLRRGYLMALCLVALGDGDWHLGVPQRPSAPTANADEP